MVATSPILSVLVVFALSLLVVRIGSVALQMTGLSPDVASFQSASAFSGTGFTTEESEYTLATPDRRRIVKALFRLGSVGLVGGIASLVLSFSDGDHVLGLTFIGMGVVALVLLARSQWLNRVVTPIIERALSRATDLDVSDYARLLGVEDDYRVADVDVQEGDWLARDTPDALNLTAEGVLVLGIRREGSYVGAPDPDTEIRPGDTVVLYGREDRLQELAIREAGDERAHEAAVEEQDEVIDEQEELVGG